jgi:SH3 domain protein
MRKTAILTIFLLLLGAGLAQGASVYVADTLEITLRSGPTNEHRIIKMLTSDTKLEVLDESEGWLQVRSPDGKEGWVLKRYTIRDLPKSMQIQRLKQQNEKLSALTGGAASQLNALEEENNSLKTSLEKAQGELDGLKAQYATLKSASADVVRLNDEFTETKNRLDTMTLSMERLNAENMELRSSTNLRWFLSGAGVVLVAWLFGFVIGRIQRKKRSGLSF